MSRFSAIDYFAKNSADTYCYHRSKLTIHEQVAYDRIRTCILSYKKSVKVFGVSGKQIQNIYQKLLHDNPNIFYVERLDFVGFVFGGVKTVFPKYRFNIEKTNQYLATILHNSEQILGKIRNGNETQKTKAIHDFLCKNIVYENDTNKSSYECVGPLVFKRGVCEGISKAVKLLFDLLGMKSLVLHGRSLQTQVNNALGHELHAWNIVEIDCVPYQLDVTFDLTLSERGIVRYDYFCLSDKEMAIDHSPLIKQLPKCDISFDYYEKNNLYMHRTDDFRRYLSECVKLGKDDIVVKLPFLGEHEKALEKLTKITTEVLHENRLYNKTFSISYNAYQMVFHLYLL